MNNNPITDRFGLMNGQFYAYYRYKNLRWFLNDTEFGYGDLTDNQILNISENLGEGEVFRGYNEHHGTRFQQTHLPYLEITKDEILLREDIIEREEKKIVVQFTDDAIGLSLVLRMECTCGWKEKAFADREARGRAERHIREEHETGELRYRGLSYEVK
ncbi:hypothetical protein KC887_02395 [Candidatus Kaiserbacteria bacterium]|nr:hypothetical protein [Candidatus Kaiserbacteria bacterium]